MQDKLYILTYTINEYNQEGMYFIAGWSYKPTFQDLKNVFDKLDITRNSEKDVVVIETLLDGIKDSIESYHANDWVSFILTVVEQGVPPAYV